MSEMVNMPVCDLRNLRTVEAAKNIENIKNVALLILPKDAPDEVLEAITAIPMKNVASTISLGKDTTVNMVNGISEINGTNLTPDTETVLVVNGLAVISAMPENAKCSLIVNGMALLEESLKGRPDLVFLMVNGMKAFKSFNEYKAFPKTVDIDAEFLSYLQPKTVILAGKDIRIAPGVTVKGLQDSQVSLFAGQCVLCDKDVMSYVKVISTVGQDVKILDDAGQHDED